MLSLAILCVHWIECREVDWGCLKKHDYRMKRSGQYSIVLRLPVLNQVSPAFKLCGTGIYFISLSFLLSEMGNKISSPDREGGCKN